MVKVWKENADIVDKAALKIAGKKYSNEDEVKAQVKKAKTEKVAKTTHEVVHNIVSKKIPKVKY